MSGLDDFLDDRTKIQAEVEDLKLKHRSLELEIQNLEAAALPDRLALQRIKKQKLAIKDRLSYLEDALTPDIIA